MDNYLIFKSIHIFGVIIFLGNIIVSAWWKIMANKTRNPVIVAFAQRQVTLTDFVFTLPGAMLLIMTGDYITYFLMQNSWDITWIAWGRILFIISGLIWLFILIPTQIKQAKLAKDFSSKDVIPNEYWKLNYRWFIFGTIAILLPLCNLYLMVFKPV